MEENVGTAVAGVFATGVEVSVGNAVEDVVAEGEELKVDITVAAVVHDQFTNYYCILFFNINIIRERKVYWSTYILDDQQPKWSLLFLITVRNLKPHLTVLAYVVL